MIDLYSKRLFFLNVIKYLYEFTCNAFNLMFSFITKVTASRFVYSCRNCRVARFLLPWCESNKKSFDCVIEEEIQLKQSHENFQEVSRNISIWKKFWKCVHWVPMNKNYQWTSTPVWHLKVNRLLCVCCPVNTARF